MSVTCCSHLENLFESDKRKEIVEKCIKKLTPYIKFFDAIAISGYSMALVAPVIADRLGKNIIIVRKQEEIRHSQFLVEGPHNSRYIIIDDLVGSGATITRMYEGIKFNLKNCRLIGTYFFRSTEEARWDHESAVRKTGLKSLRNLNVEIPTRPKTQKTRKPVRRRREPISNRPAQTLVSFLASSGGSPECRLL